MNRIIKLLHSKTMGVTVVLMKDGMNFCLPALRDPLLVAQFCARARKGDWTISFNEEGMKRLMAMPDLQQQEMSF